MRAASPPRQMERENEMIVISQLLLNLRKFRKSVDGRAGSDYNGVRICESVANLHDGFCFRKRGDRRAGGAAIGSADAVCCQIMAERIACHRQCEKETFSSPVTGHPCFLP